MARKFVRPDWGWDIESAAGVTSGTECFNASLAGRSVDEASTGRRPPQQRWHNLSGPAPVQWVHWAAPAGPVPPTGFPIFVMFEVEGWQPANGTCAAGHGWLPPPPPPSRCTALLEQLCGPSRSNWTACHRCEAVARATVTLVMGSKVI
jgi:hypothetical protein